VKSFLDLKVGDRRKLVKVGNITEKIQGNSPKIQFHCVSGEGNSFMIDMALIRNSKGHLNFKSCWNIKDSKGNLNKDSVISKIMSYYKVTTLRDLIDKEIEVYPKPGNYLTIVSCTFDEDVEITW